MAEPLRSFVMVAHGGPLEAKSAVLAASLRAQLGPEADIHVAVPEPVEHWGALHPASRRVFDAVGARLVPTRNRIDLDYPHGNKIAAMKDIDGPCAFLDSDMIVMRPFITHWSLLGVDAAAKVADINTFGRGGGNWRAAYRSLGLDMPKGKVRSSETNETMPPYYNAGFVYARRASELAVEWERVARVLDADPAVTNKRPWLDQVALPIAFATLGWTVSPITERLNFPGHLRGDWGDEAKGPVILHYHSPDRILVFPHAVAHLRTLLGRYGGLAEILSAYEEWDGVMRRIGDPSADGASADADGAMNMVA